MRPPYSLTVDILTLSQSIGHHLGRLAGLRIDPFPIQLRKNNQIKTIQSTLSIEGNSLAIEEVRTLLEGSVVIAPQRDILEVKNAIVLYNRLASYDPLSITSFKKAHQTLMKDLIDSNGKFREKGIGIFKGQEVAHVAPSAKRVPVLMDALFSFLRKEKKTPWLIKACVFHYELEFIHPFVDGNGRMGRLWQQLLLMKEDPIFEFISVEALIKETQVEYYEVLAACDASGDSTAFIEYSLEKIDRALKAYLHTLSGKTMDLQGRLKLASNEFKVHWFSRKEYLLFHKNISSATASRDLLQGVELKSLEKKGEKNRTKYRFKQ